MSRDVFSTALSVILVWIRVRIYYNLNYNSQRPIYYRHHVICRWDEHRLLRGWVQGDPCYVGQGQEADLATQWVSFLSYILYDATQNESSLGFLRFLYIFSFFFLIFILLLCRTPFTYSRTHCLFVITLLRMFFCKIGFILHTCLDLWKRNNQLRIILRRKFFRSLHLVWDY